MLTRSGSCFTSLGSHREAEKGTSTGVLALPVSMGEREATVRKAIGLKIEGGVEVAVVAGAAEVRSRRHRVNLVSGGLDTLAHVVPAVPPLQLGLHLPPIVVSSWHAIVHGTQVAVIPRIP